MSRIGKSIETESRLVVVWGWREWGMGNYCLINMEFPFGMVRKFWN